jgi:hypothetical protein
MMEIEDIDLGRNCYRYKTKLGNDVSFPQKQVQATSLHLKK